MDVAHGPLAGVRIVEFDGPGAAPFAAMLLADMGCDMVRVRRPGADGSSVAPSLYRGRSEIALDLSRVADREKALALVARADGVIGFGQAAGEAAGLDPARCFAANPRLVYGRASNWGGDGSLAERPGSDINLLALSGVLHAIGPASGPVPPLNLVGEYAGGALYLALGMVAAILGAQATGRGQIVDAVQLDGAASLMTLCYALHGAGRWADSRASNLIDGGAPFYRCYACADGRHVAVGALDPAAFAALCEGLGLANRFRQYARDDWAGMGDAFSEAFASRTRDDWAALFAGEACVTPVLSMAEAPLHPHNRARGLFPSGIPAPAPRFSETPSQQVPQQTESLDAVLERWS